MNFERIRFSIRIATSKRIIVNYNEAFIESFSVLFGNLIYKSIVENEFPRGLARIYLSSLKLSVIKRQRIENEKKIPTYEISGELEKGRKKKLHPLKNSHHQGSIISGRPVYTLGGNSVCVPTADGRRARRVLSVNERFSLSLFLQ